MRAVICLTTPLNVSYVISSYRYATVSFTGGATANTPNWYVDMLVSYRMDSAVV